MSRVARSRGATGQSRIGALGAFLTRHPRLIVGVWVLLVAGLAIKGQNLDKELKLQPAFLEGTPSLRAHEIAMQGFGSEHMTIVMLRGPDAAVERQGRELEERLAEIPGSLVVSPWTPGAEVEGLSSQPGVSALIVRNGEPEGGDAFDLLPPIERRVDATVHSPVRVSLAGSPVLLDSIRSASDRAAKIGELVALPVLLLVLLLVFRSAIAALLPVIVGGAVVAATRGVMSVLLDFIEIDLFALSAVGMMGLALGVDYSLLVVSRFREERVHAGTAEAVQTTVEAAARSILPAGGGLVLAMIAASLVLPGAAVSAVTLAVVLVTGLSVVSAMCVTPALLTLLGDNLDRWSFRERPTQVAPLRWSRQILNRPRAVVGLMACVLFFAGLAFTLDTGTATSGLLPPDDPGRVQQEEVAETLGPGWVAPIEVMVNGRGSPVTSPSRLRELAAFQTRAERDSGIETVVGFSEIAERTGDPDEIETGLVAQERGLERLDTGISKVHGGAKLTSRGLEQAAEGARALNAGAGAADTGAGVLARSLDAASSGSRKLVDGIGQVSEGSDKVAEGTSKASSGAQKLAAALQRAQEQTGEIQSNARLFANAMHTGEERLASVQGPLRGAEAQLAAVWQALQRMTTGRSDPEYAAALRAAEAAGLQLTGDDYRTGERADPSYKGVDAGIERGRGQFGVGLYLAERMDRSGRKVSEGMEKLASASAQLGEGLQRLESGSGKLSEGIGQLSRGGEVLPTSLSRLGEGAERLAGGLEKLAAGTGQLAGGLGGGAQKSKLLAGALDRISAGLDRQQDPDTGSSQFSQLQTRSPGLFRSRYFTLASLDGTPRGQRSRLSFLINLNRGGQDGRIMVIPRYEATTERGNETRERLQENVDVLAQRSGAEVVLGGLATAQEDVNDTFRADAPWVRIVLSLITFIILVPVVRSLVLPLVAALLNMVAVSAAYGVLALLFNDSLLGGPGYVDISIVPATLVVMFGLAIDYEVFLFARMREEYERTGSASAAVERGLDHTAHVITGAAMIMITVFLAFSISSFSTIRNFGVAQAVGVFVDAFIVRLIVIPAAMGWLGKWSWWMPAWLDRLLPGGSPVASGPRTADAT